MHLTEELLSEWTGLKGRDLSIFYLSYKKNSSSALLHNDLEYIKQDILKFKNKLYQQTSKKSNVKGLIQLWESKLTSNT
jgi:hypothetical protein